MIDQEDKSLLLEPEKVSSDIKKQAFAYAERQKFLEDWRKGVLNSPEGRRILWDLLGLLGYQRPMFNSDPLIMAKNCGLHDDALMVIMRDVEESSPGILFKISNEMRSYYASREKDK